MNILVFELEVTGHHANHIRTLLRYWPDIDVALTMVVSPQFLRMHKDVVETETNASIVWSPLSEDELIRYKASKQSLLRHTWVEWRLFCHYAKKTQADQSLIMYVDRFQLPLALQLPLPCMLSGIYFRPKFHYAQFTNHQMAQGEKIRGIREQWLWRSALRHPKLKTLFCLDPLAVAPLNQLVGQNKVIHLPDPVEFHPPRQEEVTNLHTKLAVKAGRKVFLLFGAIDQRKGIYPVLSALKQLPTSEQQNMTLLLVGRVSTHEKELLENAIRRAEASSVVQIILCDEYVAEYDLPLYFSLADVVLAPYQQHVGSSGILLWAAAAGKPVLASDYGLMGEHVKTRQLGMMVDSQCADAVMEGLQHCLDSTPDKLFNQLEAARFANENSSKQFTQAIADTLISPCP